MDTTMLRTRDWLEQELKFMNTDMAHTLNGRLKPELADCSDELQQITLRFPLLDWQVNGIGTLHGGMTNTMMDLAMSMAVYCFSRQSVPPTVSMATNYLRPVPMEDSVLVTARVTSLGKRNATAYAEAIIPASGKVASTAIGTYAILPK